jgi:Zn-dependent alcohol dehydrogenase
MFGKTVAAVDVEFGKPIVVDEIELPDPGPHHVVVKQFATGICHSQLHRLHNPNQARPGLLGHESTGVVVARGNGVDYVKEGDHVLLSLLPRNAHRDMAPHDTPILKFRGQDIPAGYSSHTWMQTIVSDERWVVKIDPSIPTDVTAVVGCAVQTGAGVVLNTAGVRAGNSVAVFGVGGLGLCTVQTCANVGAYPIIAVDVADDKLEYARAFGATHAINSRREDPVPQIRAITSGGADFAFDVIGVPQTIAQLMPSVRAGVGGYEEGGTGVLVGVPPGTPDVPVRDVFIGAKKFMGTLGGTGHPERDFPLYLRWFQQGKLPLDKLVTRRYTLDQVNTACTALEHGEIQGRAIIQF